MLSQLIRDEKARISLWLAVMLALTLPAVLILAMIVIQGGVRTGSLVGLLMCAAPVFILATAPWLAFAVRFRSLSSVRGLNARLARFGPPDAVAKEVDADLDSLHGAYVDGRVTVEVGSPQPNCLIVTDRWLVRLDPGASDVIKLADLVWVWWRIVIRSAPLVMGRTEHQIGYRLKSGHVGQFDTWTERRTSLALQEILNRMPELLVGYRGEWHDLATQGPDVLSVEVAARRDRIGGLSPAEQEEWIDTALDDFHRYVLRLDRQLPDGK